MTQLVHTSFVCGNETKIRISPFVSEKGVIGVTIGIKKRILEIFQSFQVQKVKIERLDKSKD